METKKTMSKGARIATLVSSIILLLGGLFMLGLTYEQSLAPLGFVLFCGILVAVNIYKLATDYNKDSENK
jgi:4-hydroxybenzoate polyprenyltransferase